jgi:GNAT superfamily N-acetyltransferase
MTNQYTIRKALKTDFTAIDEFDMFAGDRRAEIKRGEVVVLTENDEVIAYMTTARSFYQNPFIAYLQVRDDRQGRGLGRALLDFAETLWPFEKLYISTEADNAPMLHLLQSLGYQPAGQVLFVQELPEMVFCKLN